MPNLPTYADVEAAAHRIAPHAHRTPVLRSRTLDAMVGAEPRSSARTSSGSAPSSSAGPATPFRLADREAARQGVATHSSGNHAQALSLAARLRGVEAHVVMPENALPGKARRGEGLRRSDHLLRA